MRRQRYDKEIGMIFMILILIPVGIYYLIKYSIIGGINIYKLCTANKPQKKYDGYYEDISKVDMMDGFSFEQFVGDLLKRNGYKKVCVTKGSGDFGVDVIGEKDGQKWAFQCKNYTSNLGVSPIQEIYSGAVKYGASVCVVVTNSFFTEHARELAETLGVKLWDRDKLTELIGKTKQIKNDSSLEKHCQDVVQQPIPQIQKENKEILKTIGDDVMATVIGAGKYVFGEDIPLGKYNLKVIEGDGLLCIHYSTDESDVGIQHLGFADYEAKSYSGLSLPQGMWFTIQGSVIVEISKSKMLEIE